MVALNLSIVIPFVYVNDVAMVLGQSPPLYEGNSTAVMLIPNAYNVTEWKNVDNYLSNGFTIKSVIPTSELETDLDNPNRILVILERS